MAGERQHQRTPAAPRRSGYPLAAEVDGSAGKVGATLGVDEKAVGWRLRGKKQQRRLWRASRSGSPRCASVSVAGVEEVQMAAFGEFYRLA